MIKTSLLLFVKIIACIVILFAGLGFVFFLVASFFYGLWELFE